MAGVTSPTLPATERADLIRRILAEGPIGANLAARLVGRFRNGRPTHTSTIGRWIADGVKLTDGRVVTLEGYRLNGRWITSEAALVRFIAVQQGAAAPAGEVPGGHPPARRGVRSPASRRRASEAAAKQLGRSGI
jgi:hypothetical protein